MYSAGRVGVGGAFAGDDGTSGVGPLDEHFFLYCEELDYAIRARASGLGLAWCRDSVVHHHGAASTGGRSRTRAQGSALSAYHENLSHLRLTAKHFGGWRLPVAWCARLGFKLVAAALRWRWDTVGPLLRAYRDFAKGAPATPPTALPARLCWPDPGPDR